MLSHMTGSTATQLEGLSSLIMTAPTWKRSAAIMVLLGVAIEFMAWLGGLDPHDFGAHFGLLGFTLPGLIALGLTRPLVRMYGRDITWDWSGLIALIALVICVIVSYTPLLLFARDYLPLFYASSLGIIFAVRLLLLVTVVDRSVARMLAPALIQSLFATLFWATVIPGILVYSVVLHIFLGLGTWFIVWILERPMKAALGVSPLAFANAFMAYLIEGSHALEEFFREMGEAVRVEQATIFFRREGKEEAVFTVPGVHPGPLGEIGGSNLPKILYDALGCPAVIAHGASTHDFNPVSASEIEKVVAAVEEGRRTATWSATATQPVRADSGSVSVLAQAFGDTALLVATRSPLITDDLDYAVGLAIMKAGERHFAHVAFVDAHNSFPCLPPPVLLASPLAEEYREAAEEAFAALVDAPQVPFAAGFARVDVPFTREEGFGDLGIMAMVVRTDDKEALYLVFDGNNIHEGVRDELRDMFLEDFDECEIMTSDTHVVNTVSGMNPVGLAVPLESFSPLAREAADLARADAAPASAAGTTATCRDIVVFGSQRITQLAGLVTGSVGIVAPLALVILIVAFLSTVTVFFLLAG
ncbi:hypothetical protein AZH53_10370 [Methanomicrobiaceae archaeon CYW5]|nr:hypothetical protein [Methanovulcanius yangii]